MVTGTYTAPICTGNTPITIHLVRGLLVSTPVTNRAAPTLHHEGTEAEPSPEVQSESSQKTKLLSVELYYLYC